MNSDLQHQSVLLRESLEMLQPKPGMRVLDVTLGLGGHAKAFLEAMGDSGTLVGLDADEQNLDIARERLGQWHDRVTLIHTNFGDVLQHNLGQFDCILADLGLSSPHLDDESRGFSFRLSGPLDLRFDRTIGITASELIASSELQELKRIFQMYGELYKEAHKLASSFAGELIETTDALKLRVENLFGFRAKHILPQVFQALRIAVNDELGTLEKLLDAIPHVLAPGGRIGVMSYHSLEDRMVKHVFRDLTTPEKDDITGKISKEASYELITKKPIVPTEQEIKHNPRSRSAKFRILARKSA